MIFSNFVFAHHDGGRCRLKLLRHTKKCTDVAKLKGNVRFHDLRHSFAVKLRKAGVPLETIMGLMRLANIKETLIYAPYHTSEGAGAVNLLD